METISDMIKEVKDSSPNPDACLLSFSGGKDAWCSWLAVRDHFQTVQPFAYYLVPGLETVDAYLDYCERRMGCRVVRLPSPRLLGMLRDGVFQTPRHMDVIDAAHLPELTWDDMGRMTESAAGLPANTWTAVGVRGADSIGRASAFKRQGVVNPKRRVFYPIHDWRKADVVGALKREGIKLSPEYRLFGRTFDGLYLLYAWGLKQHCPADYARCLEWFPLMECEVFRLERALERYGSMDALPRQVVQAEAGRVARESRFPNRLRARQQAESPTPDRFSDLKAQAKLTAAKMRSMTDAEFMFTLYFRDGSALHVVFEDRAQKDFFLRQTRIFSHGDKYLDGEFVASRLGVGQYARFNRIPRPRVPNPLAGLETPSNPESAYRAWLEAIRAAFQAPIPLPSSDAERMAQAAGWPAEPMIWGHDVAAAAGVSLPQTSYYYRPHHRPDRALEALAT